jgi:membrane protein YqaA with SNARE-associated domain
MLRSLYNWTLRAAAHPHAMWYLAFVAFIESSVFPIPVDLMLIPMVLAAREKAFKIAFVCTAASVAGGLGGYAVGALFYDVLGQAIFAFYGFEHKFAEFREGYNEWGGWIVFGAGLTPFPYKVITIASGVTGLDLVTFVGASVLARGLRFFAVAAILWHLGPAIRRLMDRHLGWLTTAFFGLLIGGFVALKFLI